MICPNCSKEINDEASFCGYCGQIITKESTQDMSTDEMETVEEQTNQPPTEDVDEQPQTEIPAEKPKKHIGIKLLLIFSMVAIIAGAVLGLLTAKGIIDLSSIIPSNRFEWTDFSEAVIPESEPTSDEESADKKDDTATMSPEASQADPNADSNENGST